MPAVITPGGRVGNNDPLGHGGKNWVTKRGGLPDYIREVARGINPADPEAAIDEAVAAVKRWAATSKNAKVRAAASAAVAHWEAMKASTSDHSNEAEDIDLDWAAFDASRPKGAAPAGAQATTASGGPTDTPPDFLSPATHQNIAQFQAAHGLPVTGNVDAKTVAWMNDPSNSAAAQSAAKAAGSNTAAAAKKAAAAKVAADKKAAAAAKKTAAQNAAQVKATQTAANNAAKLKAAQNQAALANGRAAISTSRKTANLAVPVVGVQDGARMTAGASAFGGKQSPPYTKGGKKAKLNAVKLALARSKAAK